MAATGNDSKSQPQTVYSTAGYDPFKQAPDSQISSKAWFAATTAQAIFTTGLLVLYKYGEGRSWETHARLILTIGIVGTWSLALRTIRERLCELMRYWQQASKGLLKKASASGLHWISVPVKKEQEAYIKASIRRLRIIAAGLTIPFFVMPMMWSFISVVLSRIAPVNMKDYWTGCAVFLMLCTFIVAGYFHWVILPRPVPVRVSGLSRRFPPRQR